MTQNLKIDKDGVAYIFLIMFHYFLAVFCIFPHRFSKFGFSFCGWMDLLNRSLPTWCGCLQRLSWLVYLQFLFFWGAPGSFLRLLTCFSIVFDKSDGRFQIFDHIFAQFFLGQVFDHIFGQGFDQGFWERKKPIDGYSVQYYPAFRKSCWKLHK